MLKKGTLEVLKIAFLSIYHRPFLLEKRTGSLPIISLSSLNRFLQKTKFRIKDGGFNLVFHQRS